MVLKSHDIPLTPVDELIVRFKAAGYKHTRFLHGKQDHFKIVRCTKDFQCVHCKKQILKGQYAYNRTVIFGMHNMPNNPYTYVGFKMCSEKCVEEVLKSLDVGHNLEDVCVDDEQIRQILIQAHIIEKSTQQP